MSMGFGLAGAAGGAAKSLEELLAARQIEAYRQATLQQQAQQEANQVAARSEQAGLERQRIAQTGQRDAADETYRTGQLERQGRLDASTLARQTQQDERQNVLDQRGENARGLAIMKDEAALANPDKAQNDRLALAKQQHEYQLGEIGAAGEQARRTAAAKATTDEPNQGQFTAAGYAGRMKQAETALTALQPKIAGMHTASYALQQRMPPAGQSEDVQSYMQASRNFINAVLRRESGAVISPTEFAEARQQYLPQPGDTPQTLQQKSQNRLYVFDTMKRAGGTAYVEPSSSHDGVDNPDDALLDELLKGGR